MAVIVHIIVTQISFSPVYRQYLLDTARFFSYPMPMKPALSFDPVRQQLLGPVGALPIAASDEVAQRFVMLVEGECLHEHIITIAAKYGYCRQRYYQLLNAFKKGGTEALQPQKTGPKSLARRTDTVVRQVLRYRFLDPDSSPAVIVQKLRQTHFSIGQRSVERIIADYGLRKKTLRPEPAAGPGQPDHPAQPPAAGRGKSRAAKSGTPNPPKPGAESLGYHRGDLLQRPRRSVETSF
jgi:transposase